MKKLPTLLSFSFPAAMALLPFLMILASSAAQAQYTDFQAIQELGGPQEFARRRQVVAEKMKEGTLLMFARQVEPEADHYREDNDFYYLTGIADPGAVLLMDAKTGHSILFEPVQAPRKKQVYGPNVLSLSKDEQVKFGFSA